MKANLSDDLLKDLKQQLLVKKETFEKDIKLLESEDSFSDPDRTVGNAEEADEAAEETTHLEAELKKRNLDESLVLVNKALEKMEDGTYGTCEPGGEVIDIARLKAYPEAPTCLEHLQNA